MSSERPDPVIRLRGVSKKYAIYRRNLHRMLEAVHPLRRQYHHDFWALRGIDLDIRRGETFGILGANGSGKSTLLQIICSILQPTEGSVDVRGRVAALIELGAGFNPEVSGRRNAEMNCLISGLTMRETRDVMPSIAAFADIGEFFDQPVKTYSSGMFMRVAFATAVHVDPDILVIDEALAVGDARFQQKCFRKFREFQDAGKTILLVTHDRFVIPRLCSSALMLDAGRVVQVGEPRQITDLYSRFLQLGSAGAEPSRRAPAAPEAKPPDEDLCRTNPTYNPNEFRFGRGGAAIVDFRLVCENRVNPDVLDIGSWLDIYLKVRFEKAVKTPIVGFTARTAEGIIVSSTHSSWLGPPLRSRAGGETAEYHFRVKIHLAPGDWFFDLAIAEDEATLLDNREAVFHFQVRSATRLIGMTSLDASIEEKN